MERITKNKYKNLLFLLLAAVLGFFLPIAGLILFIIFEVNKDKEQFMFSEDEKIMVRLGLVVISIYYVINLIYSIKNRDLGTSEDSLASLLHLLIFIK